MGNAREPVANADAARCEVSGVSVAKTWHYYVHEDGFRRWVAGGMATGTTKRKFAELKASVVARGPDPQWMTPPADATRRADDLVGVLLLEDWVVEL